MGRLEIPRPIKQTKAITMQFNQSNGELTIQGLNQKSSYKVIVNEIEYDLDSDDTGVATIQFNPSNPICFYSVRIKNPSKSDQRLGFFY